MKKILMLFAAAALVLGAASCQKENFQKALAEGQEQIDYSDDPMGVIKVYIKKDDTKMAFGENEQTGKLKRSWEKDDVIDGCTKVGNEYKSFQYAVDEVGSEGGRDYVKLIKKPGAPGIPSATTTEPIHFVYAPGAVSFDSEGACSLDLSKQDESHIPAVMVASGTVDLSGEEPHLDLTGENGFKNIAAVVAIRDGITLKDVDDVEVTDYTINKVYAIARTKGTLTLNNGAYEISAATPDDFWPTTISPKDGADSFSADDPIYFAALPGEGKISAELRTDKGKFVWSTTNTLSANGYARIKNKEYKQRAEAQIGDKRYAIEDAFIEATEAEGDVTIKMVENAVTYEEIKFTKDNGKITLDLGGYNITCKDNKALYAHSDFEIKDESVNPGTISAVQTAVHLYAETENKQNVLTISGGNYRASGYHADGTGVIYSANNANVSNATCKLEIKGGTIECNNAEGRAVNARVLVEVTGGTIISDGYAFRLYNANSKATIEKAEIISKGEYTPLYSASSSAIISLKSGWVRAEGDAEIVNSANRAEISGGYFNKPVTPVDGKYCVLTDDEDDSRVSPSGITYDYTISNQKPGEAKIGDTSYPTLAEAITAANSAGDDVTIKLMSPTISVSSQIELNNTNDKKITINFNDCVINSSYSEGPAVITKSEVVFKDGSKGFGGINAPKVVLKAMADVTIGAGTYKTLEGVSSSDPIEGAIIINGGTSGVSAFTAEISSITIDASTGGNGLHCRGTSGNVVTTSISGCNIIAKNRAVYNHGYSKLAINGGCYETTANTQVVYVGSSYTCDVEIKDGYFKKKSGDKQMFTIYAQANNRITVSGGFFSEDLGEADKKNTSNKYTSFTYASGFTQIENIGNTEYPYIIGPNSPSEIDVAKVGENTFKYFNQAVAYAANCTTDVEIDLIANASTAYCNFTNIYGKKVTLDLNGNTLTGLTEGYITTKGTLEITDSSDGQGSLTGSLYNIICLEGAGDIKINKVLVTSSRTSGNRSTGAAQSLVIINGTSTQNQASITLDEKACVHYQKTTKPFYVKYGRLTINTAEVINGVEGTSYHCIYVNTGAKITINEGAFLRCWPTATNNYPVFRIESGNSATEITINGGYFCGKQIFGATASGKLACFKLNGGYYSYETLSTTAQEEDDDLTYLDNKSMKDCDPVVSYKGISFKKQVK